MNIQLVAMAIGSCSAFMLPAQTIATPIVASERSVTSQVQLGAATRRASMRMQAERVPPPPPTSPSTPPFFNLTDILQLDRDVDKAAVVEKAIRYIIIVPAAAVFVSFIRGGITVEQLPAPLPAPPPVVVSATVPAPTSGAVAPTPGAVAPVLPVDQGPAAELKALEAQLAALKAAARPPVAD